MHVARRWSQARRTIAVVALLAVATVLTGCMDVTASIDVNDDRSGSFTVEIFPTQLALEQAGGEKILDQFVDLADKANGLQVEKIRNGRGPGVRITSPEITDVSQLATPIQVTGSNASLQWFTRFDVSPTDDGWSLNAEMLPLSQTIDGAFGSAPELSQADYELSISLPGRVASTNADKRDRSTATWTLDADAAQSKQLVMQSTTGLYINPVLLVIGAAVLAGIIGVVLIVSSDRIRVLRRLREKNRAGRDSVASSGWARPPGAPPPRTGTPTPTPTTDHTVEVMGGVYEQAVGGMSVALPVGGASWGPAPPLAEPPPEADQQPRTPPSGDQQPQTSSGPPTQPPQFVHPPSADPVPAPPIPAAVAQPPPPVPDAPPAPAPAPAPAAQAPPPGWYPDPDPQRPDGTRFWNGVEWTEHQA